jgi:transposase-like protein
MVFQRGIDVSKRTVLRWVQTFGPLLAAEVRRHRRRPGTRWWVDEVFFLRNKAKEKRCLYRAVDEHGQVLDVLFRDHRDTESATAFFRRTLRHTGTEPTTIISDHYQPYIQGDCSVGVGWRLRRGDAGCARGLARWWACC